MCEFFGLLRLALPDCEDTPTEAAQGGGVAFVAGGIAFELFSLPRALGLRDSGVFAIPVQMPEAAVDKNADAMAW